MKVTELYSYEDKCVGCFACENICPHNAITMQFNQEGFYFPKIEEKQCVDCGLCAKTCQIDHKLEKANFKDDMYSFQSVDSIREKSSSGGVFYHLAKAVLEKGGVVYGAAFDSVSKQVKHTSTDNVDLEALMRSKYVQSNVNSTFKQTKKDLDEGKEVLFSGTPCQIRGLLLFLGKGYDNLLTMDFVCHGIPSSGFFQDMIGYYESNKNAHIKNVTFREKDYGWRNQVVKLYFDNGEIISEKSAYYYYYYYLFLNNVTLRKSCYQCENQESHVSDITVLDYWQIKDDDNKGVSAVCLNTDRGKKMFYDLSGDFEIKKIPRSIISSAFINHGKIKTYHRALHNRESFYSYYKKNGFKRTLDFWYPHYYKHSVRMGKIYIIGGKYKQLLKTLIERRK